jgi:hypothetical protein
MHFWHGLQITIIKSTIQLILVVALLVSNPSSLHSLPIGAMTLSPYTALALESDFSTAPIASRSFGLSVRNYIDADTVAFLSTARYVVCRKHRIRASSTFDHILPASANNTYLQPNHHGVTVGPLSIIAARS